MELSKPTILFAIRTDNAIVRYWFTTGSILVDLAKDLLVIDLQPHPSPTYILLEHENEGILFNQIRLCICWGTRVYI